MDKLNEMVAMKLNETMSSGPLVIIRVPGGWIYRTVFTMGSDSASVHQVFVPLPSNNEPMWREE